MKRKQFDWDRYSSKPQKKDSILPYVIVLMVVFAMVFLVKPALVGFSIHETEMTPTHQNAPMILHTSDPAEIDNLQDQLLMKHTNLQSCNEQNTALFSEISKHAEKYAECNGQLGAARAEKKLVESHYVDDMAKLEERLRETLLELNEDRDEDDKYLEEARLDKEKAQRERDQLRLDYDALLADYNAAHSLQEEYDTLARNTAHNICCKARVDNAGITGYAIENNMVRCTTSGGRELSC